jgi:hypothetical protein
MFDARARPRAVNPPPREAPASVRVCLPTARVSVRRKGSWWSPTARPLPVAPTHCLRSVCRPGDLHHPLDTGERVTSFSRAECFHPCEFCLSRALAETASVHDEHVRVQSGREMTPRSHAFCRPSPRTPCGGVASFEARTVRLVAPASVEGGSPGNYFSGQHGPSIVE